MAAEKKSKNVRLDNDVIKSLAKTRQGFESPKDCLRRLLSCSCVQEEMKKSNTQTEESEEE